MDEWDTVYDDFTCIQVLTKNFKTFKNKNIKPVFIRKLGNRREQTSPPLGNPR